MSQPQLQRKPPGLERRCLFVYFCFFLGRRPCLKPDVAGRGIWAVIVGFVLVVFLLGPLVLVVLVAWSVPGLESFLHISGKLEVR